MTGSTIAIAASQSHSPSLHIREIDAARALLGVGPKSTLMSKSVFETNASSTLDILNVAIYTRSIENERQSNGVATHGFVVDSGGSIERRQRSGSTGLETLAALAEREQKASTNRPLPSFLLPSSFASTVSSSSSATSSQSDDIDSMPPPPRRSLMCRQRSVSNPEGMEKWDSLDNTPIRSSRRHFVLPASILEEELAEANEAVLKQSRNSIQGSCIPENAEFNDDSEVSTTKREIETSNDASSLSESFLTPNELLCLARSRLLDDLSSEVVTVGGEKCVLSLPHTLSKYKEVSFIGDILE